MTWKFPAAAAFATAVAAALGAGAAPARAQDVTPPSVQWTLDVIRDGQQIDSFTGTTPVGQARTDTHHHVITHRVGCLDHPAGDVDLARTLTVSPTQASSAEVTLAIDAQETLEDEHSQPTPEGCRLPPQPRRINASHPGLSVPAGESVTWQIVEQDPSLAYRVRASLAPPAAPSPGQ
ncbi:MAG TPA: hypothetical protein VL689_01935 [Paraburkholderia sp.]|jgi:hypothetical protein|nr:hypothetical protein [Paraburkholderia sp.]